MTYTDALIQKHDEYGEGDFDDDEEQEDYDELFGEKKPREGRNTICQEE